MSASSPRSWSTGASGPILPAAKRSPPGPRAPVRMDAKPSPAPAPAASWTKTTASCWTCSRASEETMAGRLYQYVGRPEVAAGVRNSPAGALIQNRRDLEDWLLANRQDLDGDGAIVATFVVDQDGR